MNPKKLARRILPPQAARLAEESYRKGRIYAFQAAKGFPAKGQKVIAVTGTNGKTTTAAYINSLLKTAGRRTALYSTAEIELYGQSRLNRTHRTVPLTSELLDFFKKAKKAQADFVILEVTSQALDQHKLLGIPVQIAVMTNLTQDHLDYHGSMPAYAAAKARLFNAYCHPQSCILNADDDWYDYFKSQSVGQVISYGQAAGSQIRVSRIRLQAAGSDWQLSLAGRKLKLHSGLPGRFNVQNATAAAAVGLALDLPDDQIEQGIAALQAVPGRLERLDTGQNFTVLVDYAHTPDALKNVLQAARDLTTGRVIAVFGATGDRDKTKRPLMGEVAAKHADFTVLTDDETYTEEPSVIRAAVLAGLEAGKAKFTEVSDRREAFKTAFAAAQPGDVVVLAGMGHQDSRNMGGKLVPWSDREVALDILQPVKP